MSQAGNSSFSFVVVSTIWLNKWTHKFLITTHSSKNPLCGLPFGSKSAFATNRVRIEKQDFDKRSCQAVYLFLHLRPVVLTQKAEFSNTSYLWEYFRFKRKQRGLPSLPTQFSICRRSLYQRRIWEASKMQEDMCICCDLLKMDAMHLACTCTYTVHLFLLLAQKSAFCRLRCMHCTGITGAALKHSLHSHCSLSPEVGTHL